jgi:acyl-[acyl-carrier-protein]-phospholipid O-acyltransferase/long-chain-fatty-acid--[acyl-carrier-protein] ligase
MLGYLRAENPGVLAAPADGWYDTGDIVDIDADGFVSIRGRVKRFAKVAGEMVPLGAVEEFIAGVWPGTHAVVALPDSRRGEQLVLVTDHEAAARGVLASAARAAGLPEIFVPRTITRVREVPLLGTGKVDYMNVTQLASGLALGAHFSLV